MIQFKAPCYICMDVKIDKDNSLITEEKLRRIRAFWSLENTLYKYIQYKTLEFPSAALSHNRNQPDSS